MPDDLNPQASGTPEGGAPQSTDATGAVGAGAAGWMMPDRWKGKSIEDVARAHQELETKFRERDGELGTLRKYAKDASGYIDAFRPHLERLGHNPQALAGLLEQAARSAQAQGQPQQAAQLHEAAQRSWADLMTPHEQQQWIESFVGGRLTQAQQMQEQWLRQAFGEVLQYVNNFGDQAMRAIEMKLAHPTLKLTDLLRESVAEASGQIDPMERAVRRLTAEPEDTLRARIAKEEREKLLAEQRNAGMTTFAAGAGTGKRPLRPSTGAPKPEPTGTRTVAQAREQFLKNWDKIASGS